MHEHHDCLPQIEKERGVVESTGLEQSGYYATLENGETIEILAVDFNTLSRGDEVVIGTYIAYHCKKEPQLSGGKRLLFEAYGWILGLHNSLI
jgi:hypothetical protein